MYHDCLSPNYASEWLQMKWNSSLKFPSCTPEYLSISFELTELIINICKEFNFNAEIEFTALDLIDLFLMRSFIQLKNDNQNNYVNGRNQILDTFKIQIRTKGFLYIICILSIVSKFINSSSSTQFINNNWNDDDDNVMNASMPLNTTNMKMFLQSTSYYFSKSQIQTAEYYVFKTIGFKIHEPIVYRCIECIWRQCYHLLQSSIIILQKISNEFLRLVYLQRNTIYDSIYKQSSDSRSRFIKTDNQKTMLSASIVYASIIYINLSKSISTEILSILLKYSQCNIDDILILAFAIHDCAVSSSC